jgi:hypothetical protein
MSQFVTHSGGCHCGAVRFEVDAPGVIAAIDCNCSICCQTGYQHLIVPKSRFRLLAGIEVLTSYTFNTGIAQHLFCRICGIKSYYIPRSHPDAYSVNVRCLDAATITRLVLTPFDGRHWDTQASGLPSVTDSDEL